MVGAYQHCPAHLGARTRLPSSCARRVMPAPPERMADREDCVKYIDCLDIARRNPKSTHVCSFPCGRFAFNELHVVDGQKTNWTIEGA